MRKRGTRLFSQKQIGYLTHCSCDQVWRSIGIEIYGFGRKYPSRWELMAGWLKETDPATGSQRHFLSASLSLERILFTSMLENSNKEWFPTFRQQKIVLIFHKMVADKSYLLLNINFGRYIIMTRSKVVHRYEEFNWKRKNKVKVLHIQRRIHWSAGGCYCWNLTVQWYEFKYTCIAWIQTLSNWTYINGKLT